MLQAMLPWLHVTTGRAEFVLVRAPANSRLPVTHGLNLVTEGATPLLVGEVKPAEKFSDHIWHPLACAVELMEESSDPPQSMWWVPSLFMHDTVASLRCGCTKSTWGRANTQRVGPSSGPRRACTVCCGRTWT